jgi:hypothetical protein
MKANLIIICGERTKQWPHVPDEIVGEDFQKLQHLAYTTMVGRHLGNGISWQGTEFTVVVLVPGQEPVKGPGIFYRGCNALALTPELARALSGGGK